VRLHSIDWGSTQSTNKREEEIACFYFTNLRTYILYRMFGLFITIKYHPTVPNPYKYYPLLVLKIYEPPDLFLSPKCLEESKAHSLRCGIGDVCAVCRSLGTWQSCQSTVYTALPSTHSLSLVLFHRTIPLSKEGNWQILLHLFDATTHCLIIPCVTFIHLISLILFLIEAITDLRQLLPFLRSRMQDHCLRGSPL